MFSCFWGLQKGHAGGERHWGPRPEDESCSCGSPYHSKVVFSKPVRKGAVKDINCFFSSVNLGRFKSRWENVQKRNEVFNGAIFVPDSLNSSRLPFLPSLDLRFGINKPI